MPGKGWTSGPGDPNHGLAGKTDRVRRQLGRNTRGKEGGARRGYEEQLPEKPKPIAGPVGLAAGEFVVRPEVEPTNFPGARGWRLAMRPGRGIIGRRFPGSSRR
jgi:hypothetical protein